MSESYRFRNARVVGIVSVADANFAALVHNSHHDEDGHPLMTTYNPQAPGAVSLAEAEETLFEHLNNSAKGGGGGSSSSELQDPGDLDGYLRASGADESRTGLPFDRTSEQLFELRASALSLRAECIVEVELQDQRDANVAALLRSLSAGSAAAAIGVPDVDDMFNYDSDEDCAVVPQRRAPVQPAPTRRVRERFIVQGLFPALSPGIALDIAARPFTNNGAARARGALLRFDALQKSCGVVPARRERVALRDLRAVLLHGARMHPQAAAAVLRRMFPRAFGGVADGRAAEIDRALQGPRGDGRLSLRDPLANTVPIAALRDAFVRDSWPLSMITLMPEKRAAFSLAVLLLYPAEVRLVATAYDRRHWPSIVARGGELLARVADIARSAPHVLAVDLLKYRAALAAKSELEARALRAVRNESASAHQYWERAAHATRQLAALPELTWASFVRLCAGKTAEAPPFAGIDIYKNVLLADLGGKRGTEQTDHTRRARTTARGSTSNHMFTVLGDGAELLDDDHYDPACADGTFCLDDWRADEHERAERVGVDNAPAPDGRLTVRPFAEPEPERDAGRAPAELRDARRRCASEPSNEQFVSGLRWLLDEQIVHRETRVGTGPLNEGRRFDAYYTADMWRTQQSIVSAIATVYERGVRARLHANVALSDSDRARHAAAFDEWTAVRHTARRQLAALVHARAASRNRANKRKRDDADDEDAADPYEQLSALHDALKKEHIRARAALDRCAPLAQPDPYAAAGADANALLPRYRLVQRRDPLLECERDDGVELTDEQREAVRHALLNPLTIMMSPGGCGKTATARTVVDAYSSDQVLLVAQTAKAKLVLEERVGPASTIHSVLLRETLYKQACKRAERRVKRLARRRRAAKADDQSAAARAAAADLAFDSAFVACEKLVGIAECRSPLENVRLLLIDEMSLVDAALLCKLLAFAAPHIEKLIVLGDVDQLGSIGSGAVLRDMCHALPHCVKLFTRNFRSDGRAIFSLARDIVLRRAPTETHDFDVERNEERLRTPTSYEVDALRDSTADIDARAARAEDASLVFVAATRHTMAAALGRTLVALGAAHEDCDNPCELTPAQRDAMFEARERTHIIAPTNKLVGECNSVCRALYHGEIDPFAAGAHLTGAAAVGRQLAPKYARRLLRHDKMFFRTNFRDVYTVRESAISEALDNYPTEVNEDELAAEDADSQCAALSEAAGIEAANRVDEFVEEQAGAVPGAAHRSRRFVVPWYNSDIMTVIDFYSTAIKQKAHENCVCGVCDPRDVANAKQLCALLPHRVPPGRRVLCWAPTPAAHHIECHDAGMSNAGGVAQSSDFRRMIVLRTQAGAYKHVSVEAHAGDRSAFDFAFATTVHRYQGSGIDTVILVLPYDSDFNDRLLAYTAVTRAAKRFIVIGDPRAWRAACARTPATRRSELWLELARAAHRVHAELGGAALADALGVTDALERELLALDAAALDNVPRMWHYFPRMRRAALERAQLADL